MSQETGISWTDLSWNPTHGCYRQTLKPWTALNASENVLLKPHKLREPLSNAKAWRGLGAAAAAAGKCDGKLVFVNSMSDLFHEQVPDEYIAQVFAVMALADRHVFQVLTKRPERMREWFAWEGPGINRCGMVRNYVDWMLAKMPGHDPMARLFGWPLPNCWLGVSIENRKWVGRADDLRATPAAVRFISAEPLLGPLIHDGESAWAHASYRTGTRGYWMDEGPTAPSPALDLTGIDWLIVGGESGPGHRPMREEWARDLRDACAHSGTACFVKQLGGARPGTALEDLPEDLRIREFPAVTA